MTPDQPTPRKRGRPKVDDAARLSHVLQLRLNDVQRGYLLLMAEEWGCGLGDAVRRIVDEHLDAQPAVEGLQRADGEPASLRQALRLGRPDPEWVADFVKKHGGN